jgi:hypothetical protein
MPTKQRATREHRKRYERAVAFANKYQARPGWETAPRLPVVLGFLEGYRQAVKDQRNARDRARRAERRKLHPMLAVARIVTREYDGNE